MLAFLLPLAGLAAPDGYELLTEDAGCAIYEGPPREGSKLPTLRAECHWPDVDVASLTALLARADAWEEFLWCIESTSVLERDGDRTLVWQRHKVPGLSPRENVVWMWTTEADGAVRVHWQRADAEFVPADDAIVPTINEGTWEIRPAPGGGTVLVHDAAYDPATWVPGWLVRHFQTSGELTILSDIHALTRH